MTHPLPWTEVTGSLPRSSCSLHHLYVSSSMGSSTGTGTGHYVSLAVSSCVHTRELTGAISITLDLWWYRRMHTGFHCCTKRRCCPTDSVTGSALCLEALGCLTTTGTATLHCYSQCYCATTGKADWPVLQTAPQCATASAGCPAVPSSI